MTKIFKAAHQSVEETVAEVENLLTEGYSAADIKVVTRNDNKGTFLNLTTAEVDPVPDEAGQKTGKAFSDQIPTEEGPLGKYDLDQATTERYNKTIKNGGYVILVEEGS